MFAYDLKIDIDDNISYYENLVFTDNGFASPSTELHFPSSDFSLNTPGKKTSSPSSSFKITSFNSASPNSKLKKSLIEDATPVSSFLNVSYGSYIISLILKRLLTTFQPGIKRRLATGYTHKCSFIDYDIDICLLNTTHGLGLVLDGNNDNLDDNLNEDGNIIQMLFKITSSKSQAMKFDNVWDLSASIIQNQTKEFLKKSKRRNFYNCPHNLDHSTSNMLFQYLFFWSLFVHSILLDHKMNYITDSNAIFLNRYCDGVLIYPSNEENTSSERLFSSHVDLNNKVIDKNRDEMIDDGDDGFWNGDLCDVNGDVNDCESTTSENHIDLDNLDRLYHSGAFIKEIDLLDRVNSKTISCHGVFDSGIDHSETEMSRKKQRILNSFRNTQSKSYDNYSIDYDYIFNHVSTMLNE